jgi:UDP-glucose 4-epimerase
VATGAWHTLDDFVAAARSAYPDLKVALPPAAGTGFAGFPYVRPGPSDTSAALRELGFATSYSFETTVLDCLT